MKPEDAKRLAEISEEHAGTSESEIQQLHVPRGDVAFLLRVIEERGKEREEFRKRLRVAQTFAYMSVVFVTDDKIKGTSPLSVGGCVCGGSPPVCDCGWFYWLAQAEVLQCIPGAEVPDGDCEQCEGSGEAPTVDANEGRTVGRCDCWIKALDPKVVLGKDPA